MRNELEPAYILHTRAYRETSAIAYALTQEHGVVHLLCRGVKRKGQAQLQPFCRMRLSWSGKGDLFSLGKHEQERSLWMRDFSLRMAGFYINELVLRMVPSTSPSPELFALYENVLEGIAKGDAVEPLLRKFELGLLEIIGHPLQLEHDCRTEFPLCEKSTYHYEPDYGPSISGAANSGAWNVVTGSTLIALQHGSVEACQTEAKLFLRGLIQYYLNGKSIQSRKIFQYV